MDKCTIYSHFILCMHYVMARPGMARPGQAWPGQAGQARQGEAWPGQAWPGQAWPGQAMHGHSRPGQARLGQAWPGSIICIYIFICGYAYAYIIYILASSKLTEMKATTAPMEFMTDFEFHILAFMSPPTSTNGMKELRSGLRWMAERRAIESGAAAAAISDRILRVWPSYCHVKFYQAGHGKKTLLKTFRHLFFGLCIDTRTQHAHVYTNIQYAHLCRCLR